jgi:hypothetical protein
MTLHPKVVSRETSVDNVDRFMEAQAAEDFVPVEYKVVYLEEIWTLEGTSLEEFLNSLGAVGWDLVYGNEAYMIFSRC